MTISILLTDFYYRTFSAKDVLLVIQGIYLLTLAISMRISLVAAGTSRRGGPKAFMAL